MGSLNREMSPGVQSFRHFHMLYIYVREEILVVVVVVAAAILLRIVVVVVAATATAAAATAATTNNNKHIVFVFETDMKKVRR